MLPLTEKGRKVTSRRWYDSWRDPDGLVCAKFKMGRWGLPFLRVRSLQKLCRLTFPKAELVSLKRTSYVGQDKLVWWTAKWKV